MTSFEQIIHDTVVAYVDWLLCVKTIHIAIDSSTHSVLTSTDFVIMCNWCYEELITRLSLL
jgi:hypothetical protein